MTNEQKAILDSIRTKIEIAEAQNNRTKIAEMHMQFLINAPTLRHLDLSNVIAYLGLKDSFKTELNKMIKLYDQLRSNKINLTKGL